ncbi:hypothetical protein [Poriferisphaera sp. WC338]|uniref:hypothetical protein n=1 Tax=Poriferisphaera sp. WC338 TaxID=3425129 RepID=UPI003D81A3C3
MNRLYSLIICSVITLLAATHAHAINYNVPPDAAPSSIAAGDTLTLSTGGSVGDFFTSDAGSFLTMTGGTLGGNANISGDAHISGGNIGFSFFTSDNSNVTITGGDFDFLFRVLGNSTVNISGGTFGNSFDVNANANISGGTFGNNFGVRPGGIANITGGSFGNNFSVNNNSIANISGGTFGSSINLGAGITNFIGSSFTLDGSPIAGLSTSPTEITTRGGATLAGTLTDGSAFSIILNDTGVPGQDFVNSTATLNLIIPEPTTAILLSLSTLPLIARRSRA